MTMSPEMEDLYKRVAETQEQLAKSLEALNERPNVAMPATQDVSHQATPAPIQRSLSAQDLFDVRSSLRTKSTNELTMLFAEQARQKNTGIPLESWLNAGGYALQNGFDGLHAVVDPDVSKAVDTGVVSALIRQDLEPVLYELFIRVFPAYDRFPHEPANGLVHAWNQITAYGDAQFMSELGTVTDDVSAYHRETTNVAILATRRGITLKSQFAVIAGGMGYNPEGLEMQGGLRAMSHKMQKTIFGGHASDSGGTASNELGLYDANGFTGLRSVLNSGRAVNLDPATSPTTTGNFRFAFDQAVLEITQQGGPAPSIAWSHPAEKITFDEQQDPNVRVLSPNLTNIGVGVVANNINTIAGPIPWAIVPGDSIGNYTASTYSANNVRDIYLLDESTITLPYLGSPGPTVLDIPIGISGQLTHLFIIFLMNGLAVKAPTFSNKIRVKVAT
jgi:hypothetical protein